MFKVIITTKRRAGVSLEEFIHYYENKHVPLLGEILPYNERSAKAFRRNFINRDDPFLKVVGDGRADANPPFDCITEAEFECREDAEAAMTAFFEPQNLQRIKEDERNFIDLRSVRFYAAEQA